MTGCAGIAQRVQSALLGCGARVYLLENHANTTVDVVGLLAGGLFLESPARAGVADLTCTMLDRGTRRRSEQAIADVLESNGAILQYSLGCEAAFVRGRCLSEDAGMLIEVLGETLCEPTFPEDPLRVAREEALVELGETVYDAHLRALHRAGALLLGAQHPYARDPLGEEAIVAALGRDDLRAYHAQAMVGERLSLAVVGDIDPGRTLAALESSLSGLPASSNPPLAPGAECRPVAAPIGTTSEVAAAAHQGVRRERILIPDREQVEIICMRRGVPRSAPGFEAYGMANFLFGGSFVSRLNQKLRDAMGMTYGAQSVIDAGCDAGVWYASLGVDPARADSAVQAVLAEMQALVTEGPTEEELTQTREHLTGSFPIRLETNAAIGAALLESVRYGRGLDYVDRYTERVRAITRDELHAAARELLNPADVVIVAAGAGEVRSGKGAARDLAIKGKVQRGLGARTGPRSLGLP